MKKIVLMISAFLLVQPAFASWAKVSKDVGLDAVDPNNVDYRINVYKDSGGRFIFSTGRNGTVNPFDGCAGGACQTYSTAEEAFKAAVDGGYCGSSVDSSAMTCRTGGGQSHSAGTTAGGETGGGTQTGGTAPPTTQPATPAPETPTAPPLPEPTAPKGLNPELIAKFTEEIKKVRIAYLAILQRLERDAKNAEIQYAKGVIECERYYAGYSDDLKKEREKCNKIVLDNFQLDIERIKKAMGGTVTAYNQAIQNIKEAIAKEAGIKAEELPDAPDLSKPIPSLCYVDNKWSLCAPNPSQPSSDGANNQNGGGTTNNNSSTTNNSTVNNNNSSTTNNNNSSTTVINNGNNSENQGKDYSGFLGGIQKTLDSILAKIGNGGKDKPAETGSGDKGQENGNENGNDDKNKEGNQISEYCKENPNSVQCANVGTAEEINQAINQAKGEGRGFNIDEHKGVLPGFARTRDFVEMGSCPPPKTVNIFGTAHQFSYQPLCDVAIRIRPIVVFAGIFMAALMARSAIMSR